MFKEILKSHSTLVLLVLALIGGAVAYEVQFGALAFKSIEPSHLGTSLGWLILFALFIERATEVFMNMGKPAEGGRLSIHQVERDGAKVKADAARVALTAKPDDQAALKSFEDARTKLDEKEAAYQETLASRREERRPKALVFSMVLGLAVALVGGRVLASFVESGLTTDCVPLPLDATAADALKEAAGKLGDTKDATLEFLNKAIEIKTCDLKQDQQLWLAAVDVSITGALLAGGADGIHSIVKSFTGYFEESS